MEPFLAELGNVTPYGCWLTSVKQGNKPDQMSIAGKAMKMDDIVKFISLYRHGLILPMCS